MSIDALYLVRRGEPRTDLKDLDRVALRVPVTTDDGDVMAAGTEGTVVGIWREGAAYEVEFAHPEGALATVEACELHRVGPGLSGPDWPLGWHLDSRKVSHDTIFDRSLRCRFHTVIPGPRQRNPGSMHTEASGREPAVLMDSGFACGAPE